MRITRTLLLAALVASSLAGCLTEDDQPTHDPTLMGAETVDLGDFLHVAVAKVGNLTESVVPAISYGSGLYEPTMEVSPAGTIFVTGHTTGIDTTGAPVYASYDNGTSWTQLPFLMNAALPNEVHGATPPPSDEIFLVAGDDGWLYGADITLPTYPLNAWSDEGRTHAYHNPNGYDDSAAAAQSGPDCAAAPIKDRPWAAYANGTLLLVNNPASGPAQVGVMQVPPPLPAGAGPANGPTWNMCAGAGSVPLLASIPGVPDIRGDGLFAVPQRARNVVTEPTMMHLVVGNAADVMDTHVVDLFEFSSQGEVTSFHGHAAFDGHGTLFVAAGNNTVPDADDQQVGQLRIAMSTDGAETFTHRTLVFEGGAVRHYWLDGNREGPGAMLVWSTDGETTNAQGNAVAFDWYVGHLGIGADGGPVLTDAFLAIDEGISPVGDMNGAAIGPDGRAHIVTFDGAASAPGGTPLSVWIQQDGPMMTVDTE